MYRTYGILRETGMLVAKLDRLMRGLNPGRLLLETKLGQYNVVTQGQHA